MRGKIKAIFEKEKVFGITFNGDDWYTGFINDKPNWLIKGESNGTEVEFDFSTNNSGGRTYNNIVAGTLKKIESKPEPTPTLVKEPIKEEPETSKPSEPYFSKDEQTRRDIRASVAVKGGIDIMSKTVALASLDESETRKEDIIKRVIYFAEKINDWLKMKSEQNFP